MKETEIDQVFIGSCTNGRLEDLRATAEVKKAKKVADYVKSDCNSCKSKYTVRQLQRNGDTLAEAGAMITHPDVDCAVDAGGILTDG